MLNSSYDGEIEQWDMIDKYSMNVIYILHQLIYVAE